MLKIVIFPLNLKGLFPLLTFYTEISLAFSLVPIKPEVTLKFYVVCKSTIFIQNVILIQK